MANKGINRVHLIGNLVRDPELRQTAGGNSVVNFTVATSESWRDKQTGETKESTEYTRCFAWGRLAEIVAQYTRKGSKVYVEGRLQTRSWEKDGEKRYSTEINVKEFQMLDRKESGNRAEPNGNRYDGREQAKSYARATGGADESDIPFNKIPSNIY